MELNFGKHKGRKISDPEVPTSYLEWLRDVSVDTVEAIQAELVRREQMDAENLTLAERVIRSGYRTIAKEHKDEPDQLRELEGARAALEELLEQYLAKHKPAEKIQEIRSAAKRRAR